LPAGTVSLFKPISTVSITSSTVSANVQLAGSGEALMITNASDSLAYIRFGSDSSVTATMADTPVLPGSKVLFQCGPFVSYCAAALDSGSGPIYFTRGEGSGT
jgi:hypothetical protein